MNWDSLLPDGIRSNFFWRTKSVSVFLSNVLMVSTVVSGSFFVVSDLSYAAPARERSFESVRGYGRGKTFVAANESDESVFMNPATLSEDHKKTVQIRWLQFDLFAGQNVIDTISDITNFDASAGPVAILQDSTDKFGKQQYGKLQFAPLGVRILNFDIAPFFSTANFLDMRIPTTPEARIYSNTMAGANISFAMAFGKQLHVGATVRPFFRSLFDVSLGFAEIMEFEPMGDKATDDVFKLRTGTGVGFDLGSIYKIGKKTRLGLVIEDIGQTGYMLTADKDQKDTPPSIPANFSLGIQSRLDFKSSWNLDWSVDLQDMLNPDELNFMRLLHAGFEVGRSYRTTDNDLGMLVGLNEGYLTFGAFVDMWMLRLDVVSYGVELGEIAGQRQDRRIGGSIKTSLFF